MIGSLMYLTASRPDIMFDVCACARHQVTPKECHLHAVKRIFRYLKGHPKLGHWYPKDSPFDLVSFSDSDYGGTSKFWGVLRMLMIRLRLIPIVSKGTSKYWGVLRILMISLRVIPLGCQSRGACPTDSGLIKDQDRETIAKSSTLPYDSAPRITSPVADEGIKGRSMDEREAATERISDDSEEMATVLTSIDIAIVLASGVADVPTSSGSIPTASTPAEEQVSTGSDVVPTASPVFATATVVTSYSRRKGKEVMVGSETPKKQRV
nr:putative ribonuclease H-like domain-containing protein [Tanacetum cinerariifolium]